MKFEVPAIDHFQLLSSCECNPNVIPACSWKTQMESEHHAFEIRLVQNHLPNLRIPRLPEQLHQHLLGKQLLPWPLQWRQRWRQGQHGSAGSVGRVGRAECSGMPRMITLWSGWLVCLFGFLCLAVFWCWCLFCLLLFVWLVVYCHKGIFELDENPRQLGSAGSPMKLIDPPILSELSINWCGEGFE